MTNNEAVKILNDMQVKILIPKAAELQRKKNEAIDMAIEALNSSEFPNNSDTVSRKMVLDALENELRYGACVDYCGLDTAVDIVSELPSAKPKTGRWNCGDNMYEYGICSYCGWDSGEPWEYCLKNFKYCPNCGSYNGGGA